MTVRKYTVFGSGGEESALRAKTILFHVVLILMKPRKYSAESKDIYYTGSCEM